MILLLDHRQWAGVALVAAVAVGGVLWGIFRPKTSPEEMERLRRAYLADQGRITDAMLVDSSSASDWIEPEITSLEPSTGSPSVLRYQYRIAGVTYECAQDVSLLGDRVSRLRMDLPVQVRYDPHNPTNSIVVAEAWSGLRQS